ncbi:hypothetical protein [Amycolatopsis sp. NPDC059657]|uniref:hypothetical protein n=1 Tax=Amycolatopsis sp. NPDC059657 TaxID=3346899 RepID=UPI00366A639E
MSLPPSVLDIARPYANRQTALAQEALAVLGPATRAGASNPTRWRNAIADAAENLLVLQVATTEDADRYVTAVLEEQGATVLAGPEVNTEGFADITEGGGSWLKNLIYAPISVAKAARTLGSDEARRNADLVAMSIVLTGMQDTGRAAAAAAMTSRGANRYVRMLNGKSCARCAVLAGRVYKIGAFRRHPRCDCRNIPAAEDVAGDWTTDPKVYFRSLSTKDQDRIFTSGGAQAIRDGANISQVVNARQGIEVATAFGQEVKATTVGTTRRATFGGYEILDDGTFRKRADSEMRRRPGKRNFFAKAPRLLPDEIYSLAEQFGWDRTEILRQLRRFGYLL